MTAWHHLRRWVSDPAYRALHRFHGQLRRVARYQPATLRFEGRPLRLCDGPSFLSAWDEVFVNRIYDLGDLRGTPRLVDAGANVGLAAVYWKRRYGEIHYTGFEPDPAIAAVCRENLAAWGVGGSLIEAAVGPQVGEMTFLCDGADGGRLATGGAAAGAPGLRVRVEELAPYLCEPVDLLKIDIEGAEAAVLPALAPAIREVRRLFVEWHVPATGPSGLGEAIARLESWGFAVQIQPVSWPDSPFQLTSAPGDFRQQLNVFASRP